jgi:hypothetical protein
MITMFKGQIVLIVTKEELDGFNPNQIEIFDFNTRTLLQTIDLDIHRPEDN